MKSKKKEGGSGFEEGLLKLLRTLPKVRPTPPSLPPSRVPPFISSPSLPPSLPQVLKYLPTDKAEDARTFIMSFQY